MSIKELVEKYFILLLSPDTDQEYMNLVIIKKVHDPLERININVQ